MHRLGVVLAERPPSLAAALDASGLGWRVEQVPSYRHDGLDGMAGAELPDVRANVRADSGALLGVVSRDYRVVQNCEAFAFLANLTTSRDLTRGWRACVSRGGCSRRTGAQAIGGITTDW